MKAKFIPICIVLLSLILTSCGKQLFLQRKYTKGRFWDRKEPTVKPGSVAQVQKKEAIFFKELVQLKEKEKGASTLLASTAKLPLKPSLTRSLRKRQADACSDTLVYTDGSKVACRVTEIGP